MAQTRARNGQTVVKKETKKDIGMFLGAKFTGKHMKMDQQLEGHLFLKHTVINDKGRKWEVHYKRFADFGAAGNFSSGISQCIAMSFWNEGVCMDCPL